jgi:hypothetical protein
VIKSLSLGLLLKGKLEIVDVDVDPHCSKIDILVSTQGMHVRTRCSNRVYANSVDSSIKKHHNTLGNL